MKTLFEEIIKALKPLVDIADAYDAGEFKASDFKSQWLDHADKMPTLEDCQFAREVTKEIQKRMAA